MDYLARFRVPEPRREEFTICTSFSCESHAEMEFTDQQWAEVRALFEPLPGSAAEERERVAEAVALMETLAGEKAGLAHDQPRNDWLEGRPRGQLDCVAEAVNASVYLMLLENRGLLRNHTVAHPARKGWFPVPHGTAVIRELDTGREWAVDSWYYAHGEEPWIGSLDDWYDGEGTPPKM
jgi:hypothetical protein